jgi:predicted flap endonuclease-1-like 5' DNA nuclease
MQAPAPASSAAALEPVAEEAISGASPRPGLRPPATDRPETGEDEDNFLLIRGVDPTLSYELHEIGVWRFSQIAAWRQDHLDWIAHEFRQLSPVSARFWPPQARLLAAGALTDYARAVLRGETPPQEVDENTLAAFVADLPRVAPGGAGDGLYAGVRPAGFSEPPLAEKDDLTLVAGIDAEQAARLNGLGVWSWRQIARWSPENARWIGAYLATPGAPERENWVGQARTLVARESHPA